MVTSIILDFAKGRVEMNKQILIIFGILLIGITFALDINITSGETYSFQLDEPYAYYIISGNSSPVDLMIISSGNWINLTLGKYANESFILTFYNEQNEIISGGSSSPRRIILNQTIPPSLDNYTGNYLVCYDGICYTESPGEPVKELKNETNETETSLEPEIGHTNWLLYLMIGGGLLFIILMILLYFYFKYNEK